MLPRLMAVLQTAAFLFRHRAELVARAGVEPAWTDSESVAWPIGQRAMMVSAGGFEPPIPCFQGR